MNIYCVSLPLSTSRRNNFIKQAKREKLDFCFWDGFSPGESLSHQQLNKGQLGCYLAHLSLWQHLLVTGVDNAIIFEDDVHICNGFLDKFSNIVEQYFEALNPDFLYFGYSEFGDFYDVMHRYKRINKSLIIPGYPCGTFAYWVNRKTIEQIYTALKTPSYAVDNAMFDKVLKNKNTFACCPKLVLAGNFPSTIFTSNTTSN